MSDSTQHRDDIAIGGKSVYGASVGILMLDARFPRIPGDMGNALTWPFPVHFRVVRNATPDHVVRRNAEGLLDAFVEAGQDLVDMGVSGITTNCGFLSLFQDDLKARLNVPVAASSLMQVPMLQSLLPPGKRVGILTVSGPSLTSAHLEAAGIALDTPIVGTETGDEFTRVLLDNEERLDVGKARADNIAAAQRLVREHSDIGAIVLECTNMVPYAADISRATGLPVHSIYSFVLWFQAGLVPRVF